MFTISLWGLGFIILGTLVLINSFFGLDFPIFKILLALLLIYAGVSILINPPQPKTIYSHGTVHSQQIAFGKRNFKHDKLAENYQISFGQGAIDFREQNIEKPTSVNIGVTFGNAVLKLDPQVPTLITANASFGKIEFPDNTQISMGSYVYRTHPEEIETLLTIKCNVTFGSLEIQSN
jgi:hypothetical protein